MKNIETDLKTSGPNDVSPQPLLFLSPSRTPSARAAEFLKPSPKDGFLSDAPVSPRAQPPFIEATTPPSPAFPG